MGIPKVSFAALSGPKSGDEHGAAVDALVGACSDWGFAYLSDAVAPATQDAILNGAEAFFRQPGDWKMRLATQRYRPESANRYRGYFPAIDGANALKEGLEVGWEGYSPSGSGCIFDERTVWPSEDPVRGWRALISQYFELQLSIGHVLLETFELAFELPHGYFTDRFRNTLSTLRLLHYPPIATDQDATRLERGSGGSFSTPAHTDSGIVTLLLQDRTGGLQVRAADGSWADVPPVEGALVMNIGDLLEMWTGGQFKPTEHRVKSPETARYSVPFFFEPEADACIEPFEDSEGFKPILYRDYLQKKLETFIEYQTAP